MRAPRSFRAALKLSLFAVALVALYHLAPALLAPRSPDLNGRAYPTPDPLLRRKAPARAQQTAPPTPGGFDYEGEKRRWAEGQRARGGEDEGERRMANDWTQQDGRVAPRRGAGAGAAGRPDSAPPDDAGERPQPARVVGLNAQKDRAAAALEARRKIAAERVRAREQQRQDEAAAAAAAARALKVGDRHLGDGDDDDEHGAAAAGAAKGEERNDGATFEAELALAAARKARARDKLREWDERAAAAAAAPPDAEDPQAAARGRAGRKPMRKLNAQGRVPDRAQRVAAALREQQQDADDGYGHEPAEEDGELDAAPRGAGAGRRVAAQPRKKKGPLIQVGGARGAAAFGGDSDDGPGARPAAVAGGKERGVGVGAGAGWGQRFKKPAPPPPAAPPVDRDASSRADAEPAPAPPKFEHHLVARFAKHDYAHDGRAPSVALVLDPDSDDEVPLAGSRSSTSADDKNHNITICALVPNENRFIGEWLLYHRLLGVERFALYDTSTPGAFGAAEVDALADRMQREGGGELGPTVEELKASVGTADAGPDGLDEQGEIRKERIVGMERWIDSGVVKMHWLKFSDKKKARDFHSHMLDHCTATYGPSSNWLAHLDVDEFLSTSTGLYSADEPYRAGAAGDGPWQYPLHDVLARPALAEAACVPLPELNFRNYGVRELGKGQSVIETQTHRDVLKQSKKVVLEEGLQQKTFIHTAYSSKPVAQFAGPHSCEVAIGVKPAEGLTTEIRNSQGTLLQDGGLYEVAKLPIEPLAVAHYLQRDLRDCLSKLSSLADPNDLHAKSRGVRSCEEHYLPTPSERRTLADSAQNRFLLETPPPGTVIEDERVAKSWAAQAVKELHGHWQRAEQAAAAAAAGKAGAAAGAPRLRGKGRMAPPAQGAHKVAAVVVPLDVVERARSKVEIVSV
ncbi:uncharacterized protein RHOBADRAFT_51619 [Rhodotorula graminis WP1]|uniref:Glycosyltransferase family 92 protein n=1 Tax=Rhodotorula graminis (strain WP1) TaxID=578459 RepID=A0A194SB30_RHOGW|nr:uncharacterized protein RHOBADRAFT_51619 [Rhodotorula graminis WP1]KPV77812.1 hypothetical protein RHOBADRAFT_51619 [Rhodotorula graminis WP1]